MFTGIITAIGSVRELVTHADGRGFVLACPWTGLEIGESIAVDGACLTVVECGDGWFRVDVIATTLERTLFEEYVSGRRVNLERALRAGDRLGGHLVQGHVDGVGRIVLVAQQGDARLLDIEAPHSVTSISIPLGSITVDGVSLTINRISGSDRIQISLIPFTLQATTLGEKLPGDRVHLEGDTLGKYVKQLGAAWGSRETPS